MHLKKMEIFGFKSFADKTEVRFERGITCIVGPNGCGKSNISDSIRWVLGERSAKLLRGSKMEDVIFNGTEFRKPVNLAEVSITIDNSDRALPIDFEEVVLTRRLYRSGDSEYLINKTPCRYKDIQDLILNTGVGSSSYSMIEQGRIDYILNAHEEERRFLIEEAAGISKFKLKKEEALRKLERTEDNLLRLNDIVSEVDKNIKYAERQAKKAEKYKEKLEELKRMEIQKAFVDLEALINEKNSLSQEHGELSVALQQTQSELNLKETEFREIDSRVASVEELNTEVERKKYDIKLRLSHCEEKIRLNSERKIELLNTNQALEKECALAQYRIESFVGEQVRKQNELNTLREELEALHSKVEILARDYSAIESDVSVNDKTVKEYRAALFDIAREMTDSRNRHHKVEMDAQNEMSKKIRAEQLIGRLLSEKDETQMKIDNLGEDPVLQEDFNQKSQAFEFKSQEKSAAESTLRTIEDILLHQKADKKQKQSQIDLLEELEREGVFDDAVSSLIMEESKKEGSVISGLVQSLWDVIDVQDGYESAIRAALSDWAHMLIVSRPEDALQILEFAKASKAKQLAMMIKTDLTSEITGEAPAVPGVLGKAKDYVKTSPEYQMLIENQLSNVLIVEAFSQETLARWTSPENLFKIVTQDGFVLGPGPRIQYLGTIVNSNAQTRKKDLQRLRESIALLESETEKNQLERGRLAEELEVRRAEFQTIEKDYLDAKVHYQSTFKLKESLLAQLTRYDEEIMLNRLESEQAAQGMEHLTLEKEKLEADIHGLKEKEDQFRLRLEQEVLNLNTLAQRKDELYKVYTEEEQKLERFKDRERFLLESIDMLDKNQISERNLQEKRKSQYAENERILADIEVENKDKGDESVRLAQELEVITRESQKIATEKISLTELRTTLFTDLQRQKTVLDKAKERERDIQLKQMEFVYKESAIDERMKQTYHIQLNTLDKSDFQIENVDQELLTQDIQSLREKLESLGTVNLLAIEEFNSLKERFDFLSTQKQDLEKSREDLFEAIRKINRETKKLFEDTFLQVKQNFKEFFRVLFGGGEAELMLMDESNPLESGIDIMVRPPGKKNSTISLLSGGEKALTATALLFALFKIKPSPFCVLDEVDAPLDESNVHRFLEVVKGFLDLTQFIVVTHNRKTISAGDSLYGVTMEEAGVSKLVSVRLVDDRATQASAPEQSEQANELNEIVNT